MKDVSDLVGWILGLLGSIALVNWRLDKKSDNEKFKTLFEAQSDNAVRLGKMETEIKGINQHHLQTLEDIKLQQADIAKDIKGIEIALASLPKRNEDR